MAAGHGIGEAEKRGKGMHRRSLGRRCGRATRAGGVGRVEGKAGMGERETPIYAVGGSLF